MKVSLCLSPIHADIWGRGGDRASRILSLDTKLLWPASFMLDLIFLGEGILRRLWIGVWVS
jgi:hypothetical protein